jgi:hypothetical protein
VPAPISVGQWNRTLLHRQHLLARADEDAIEVLDRIVGMQSQDPRSAFFGLFSRIDGFEPGELDDLLTDREVVRMALLRSTIFLVDGADARWIRPVAQEALDAEIRTIHRGRLSEADPSEVITAAVDILAGRAVGGAELGATLSQRFPEEQPATLVAVARCGLPLVQIPPRGLWRGRGAVTYRLFDEWIGPGEPALVGDEARRELIRLYLRGFGPASVPAIQTWSGLRGLRPLVEEMERDWELQCHTGPDGQTLYDLEGLDLIPADTPAPVRLIAPFDHILVAQADRARIADEELFARTVTPNGRSPGFVLCDGRLAGTWSLADDGPHVDLFVEPSRRVAGELDDEVDRLRAWLAAGD